MKCAVHAEVDATGFCRNCGKALCPECKRDVRGILYCEGCLADLLTKPQPAIPGPTSPGLAAVLGFIPGMGAVYNGEYMKAVIHVVIFAGLVGFVSGDHGDAAEAVGGILIAAFIFYMAIDAYRTAQAKMLGQPPPASLANIGSDAPVGPLILIGLGVLFLLDKFGMFSVGRLFDFWPVFLIVLGVLLLWKRMRRAS